MALTPPYFSVLYVDDSVDGRETEGILEKQVSAYFDRPVVFTVVSSPFHALERIEMVNVHVIMIRDCCSIFPAQDFVQILRSIDISIEVIFLVPDSIPKDERAFLCADQPNLLVVRFVPFGGRDGKGGSYVPAHLADFIQTLANCLRVPPQANLNPAYISSTFQSIAISSQAVSSRPRTIPPGGGRSRGVVIAAQPPPPPRQLPKFVKAEPQQLNMSAVLACNMPPLSVHVHLVQARAGQKEDFSPTSISEYSPRSHRQAQTNIVHKSNLKRKRFVVSEETETEESIFDSFLKTLADDDTTTASTSITMDLPLKRFSDVANESRDLDLNIDWDSLKSNPFGFVASPSLPGMTMMMMVVEGEEAQADNDLFFSERSTISS